MDRNKRTLDMISAEQLETLKEKSVCVVGVGGLGGYAVEMLARIGLGNLTVVDSDEFDVSNLNRQLFANEQNIGISKVYEAQRRVSSINSKICFKGIKENLNEENAIDILSGADIALDCVDNLKTRYVLQSACNRLNIPFVHGAVGSWQGQVSTIFPKERTISKIYGNDFVEETPSFGTGSFLPALIASYQVAECVKVLTNTGEVLREKVLYFDMFNNQFFTVDTSEDWEEK